MVLDTTTFPRRVVVVGRDVVVVVVVVEDVPCVAVVIFLGVGLTVLCKVTGLGACVVVGTVVVVVVVVVGVEVVVTVVLAVVVGLGVVDFIRDIGGSNTGCFSSSPLSSSRFGGFLMSGSF